MHIHTHPSGAHIVFGLDWSPLIGRQPERLGLQRALALDASHYVLAGSTNSCAVGVARLDPATLKKNIPIHSAAVMFSKQFSQGAVGCLVPTPEGACWMLVCHAGVVLSRTDRWFSNETQALAALASIRERFPTMQLLREPMLATETGPTWLFAPLSHASRMQGVTNAVTRFKKYTRWALYALIICLGAYLLFEKKSDSTVFERVDIERAWRQALQEQSSRYVLHDYGHLQAVLQTWLKIPTMPMGWQLKKIQCEPQLMDWECSARFIRLHRLATNAHLEAYKPADWKIEFSPLEEGVFLWNVRQAASPLDLSEPWMVIDWMSYLQNIGIAFEHIQVGQAVEVPLKLPLDVHGHALPKPNIFPKWKQRTLMIKGPLRAISSLKGFAMPMRWRRATLHVESLTMLSLERSALTLELIGDMFDSHAK